MSRPEARCLALLYEHAVRELDVACAVKALLETRHGIPVELVHFAPGTAAAVERLRPRVVALPYCYTERNFFIAHDFGLFDWRDATFVNLAWEQLLYRGNREAKLPRGEFAVRHVLHHAWGEFFATELRGRGVPEAHLFVNGNPGYALYREPYRGFYAGREALAARYGLDAARRWVFFPENYIWAFYSEARLAQLIVEGCDPTEVREMRAFCRESLAEVVRWCAAAAGDSALEVILRPRPTTSIEEFREVAEREAGAPAAACRYIKGESIREWTLASDVVVSSFSTSLPEAAVAGRPTYLVEPIPTPAPLRVEWHGELPHLRTLAEFLTACARPDPLAGRELERWAGERMLANGDPIAGLADWLARVYRQEAPLPPPATEAALAPPGRLPLPAAARFAFRRQLAARERRRHLAAGHTAISPPEASARAAEWRALLVSPERLRPNETLAPV
jgi:hypothetical protein